MSFFDLGDDFSPKQVIKKDAKRTGNCTSCGLLHKCESPRIQGIGSKKYPIMIVLDYPSQQDDLQSGFFKNVSSQQILDVFDAASEELGEDVTPQDCYVTYAVKCHKYRQEPSEKEASHCRRLLLQEIDRVKPKVILTFGTFAIKAVIGSKLSGRLSGIAYEQYFGEAIPDRDFNCWVFPTYSYKILQMNDRDKGLATLWKNHVRKALFYALREVAFPKLYTKVEYTKDVDTAISYIDKALKEAEVIAFDYETTGIKPYREEQELVTASFAYGDTGYAFPVFEDGEFREKWKRLLRSPKIGKVAHKADFEIIWTKNKLGYYPNNLIWDTCLGQHVLNNKKKTGLKFLTYVELGVLGFDDAVDEYITKTPAHEEKYGKNALNKCKNAPMDVLLKYNAYDSLYTLQIYEIQEARMSKYEKVGNAFFTDAIQKLARVQDNGLHLDAEYAEETLADLADRTARLEKKIYEDEECKRAGITNIKSNVGLEKGLYDVLGYPRPDKNPTNAEALALIDSPFVNKIAKYKKLTKVNDFINNYSVESTNGVIHPFFNLHIAATYRSSSSDPNFQNIPKRDKMMKDKIRSALRPSPGNMLVEYDYKAIEVGVGACYHKDPQMITYLEDPSTDMHRDTAMDCFFRDLDTFTKEERQAAKNSFVFPAFYGSTVKNIAPALWKSMNEDTRNHVLSQGIGNFDDYYQHIADMEKKFWEERFPVYKQWKDDSYKHYLKHGYVELYTGFRCRGWMSYLETGNYPIQGSAFHCLLWTLTKVEDEIRGLSGRSKVVGQIHDALIVDVHPDEEAEVDKIVHLWGTQKLREHWDWIIVPLVLEKEATEVDGSWAKMSGKPLLL